MTTKPVPRGARLRSRLQATARAGLPPDTQLRFDCLNLAVAAIGPSGNIDTILAVADRFVTWVGTPAGVPPLPQPGD